MNGKVRGVDHIGIAVESIEKARAFYEKTLGLPFGGIEEVPDQGVRVAFFQAGETRIELLEPLSPESAVGRFLQKRGPGIHHLAFRVDNLEERLASLQSQGIRLIDEKPRTGAHGTRIAFVHPKDTGGVLTELCEG